jgi:hypothetical protein
MVLIAKGEFGFVFIFAFFPSRRGKHKCRFGVDLVAVKLAPQTAAS